MSAQALTQHRIDGIEFHVVGFTNLTHDHLDDYGTMERYYATKARLFTPEFAHRAVIVVDTPWGERLARETPLPHATFASDGTDASAGADWTLADVAIDQAGTSFTVRRRDGDALRTRIPVIGAQMALDAALAIALVVEGGHDFAAMKTALEGPEVRLPPVPGRTENVSGPGAPAVYVDFGHTPDAFAKTLPAVRAVTPGRVIMVFGASGDRDHTKRPDMARIAVRESDALVITDHHPRFEDPAPIRQQLAAAAIAARADAELHVIAPPERAIDLAVSLAKPGDSILWAGPGHLNYRDIRGVHVPYSARREAMRALHAHGYAVRETPLEG